MIAHVTDWCCQKTDVLPRQCLPVGNDVHATHGAPLHVALREPVLFDIAHATEWHQQH